MALPNNILQNVQTYQKGGLARLQNSNVMIGISNKKFKNFNQLEANLGDTVTFDLPPNSRGAAGLVVTFEGSQQRVQSLVASQSYNVPRAFSTQQFIFNVEQYMNEFGISDVTQLGAVIEADLSKNITSSVQNALTGQLQTDSGPYRFYGDGTTPINSFGQLAQALTNFRDVGTAMANTRGILPLTVVSQIVNSGLNQFVMDRNEKLALSWKLGKFSDCEWYQSNLLPKHQAGTVGDSSQTLTLISTNDPTGQNVTQLTFSGATVNDLNAIKSGDLLQFQDGVSGQVNGRYLTKFGQTVTDQPIQFRATADAIADGSGNVVINIFPALVSAQTQNQNINRVLSAGMQAKALPSHRAGVIYSGNALFMAMPMMPDEVPYPTANKTDPETGASMRMYYGSLFGQNQRGIVYDAIWGSTLVPEYSMRLIFPL